MSTIDETPDVLNRRRWTEVVQAHLASPIYRVPEIVAGGGSLTSIECHALSGGTPATTLHSMCHIGTDSILLSRMGFDVVGVDWCLEAVSAAAQIAREAGARQCRFVASDAKCLPFQSSLFELVFLNWGSLVWIRDIECFLSECHRVLADRGRLVLVDTHPVAFHFKPGSNGSPLIPNSAYFREGLVKLDRRDYATPDLPLVNRTVIEVRYTLATLLELVKTSGFASVSFEEYDALPWPAFPTMKRVEETLWRLNGTPVPLSFSLVAARL
jgi:ubiquinone/menaquinone biosynthesis C-methylase UbiE